MLLCSVGAGARRKASRSIYCWYDSAPWATDGARGSHHCAGQGRGAGEDSGSEGRGRRSDDVSGTDGVHNLQGKTTFMRNFVSPTGRNEAHLDAESWFEFSCFFLLHFFVFTDAVYTTIPSPLTVPSHSPLSALPVPPSQVLCNHSISVFSPLSAHSFSSLLDMLYFTEQKLLMQNLLTMLMMDTSHHL